MSVVGSSVVDSHTSPCFCLDSMNLKNTAELALQRNSVKRKQKTRPGSLELSSTFVDSWYHWRLSCKAISGVNNVNRSSRRRRRDRRVVIVNELAGQYEDAFDDVKGQILNYFTYKAVRTVLTQLYEMNPTNYTWLYNFVVSNKPGDGKQFLRLLVKERQDLAERVMVTRLHLYGKWIKKCDHTEMYKEISDENLGLLRERLMETVIWPSDDSNTEKIG